MTKEEILNIKTFGVFDIFVPIMVGLSSSHTAGVEGGCQSECGSAAAMDCCRNDWRHSRYGLNAGAILFKNILGLVCDPVAGLVEIPCAKRNLADAINALSIAYLVMAGVSSKIPFDDTLATMYKISIELPTSLRDTSLGGLAVTKTGLALKNKVFSKN